MNHRDRRAAERAARKGHTPHRSGHERSMDAVREAGPFIEEWTERLVRNGARRGDLAAVIIHPSNPAFTTLTALDLAVTRNEGTAPLPQLRDGSRVMVLNRSAVLDLAEIVDERFRAHMADPPKDARCLWCLRLTSDDGFAVPIGWEAKPEPTHASQPRALLPALPIEIERLQAFVMGHSDELAECIRAARVRFPGQPVAAALFAPDAVKHFGLQGDGVRLADGSEVFAARLPVIREMAEALLFEADKHLARNFDKPREDGAVEVLVLHEERTSVVAFAPGIGRGIISALDFDKAAGLVPSFLHGWHRTAHLSSKLIALRIRGTNNEEREGYEVGAVVALVEEFVAIVEAHDDAPPEMVNVAKRMRDALPSLRAFHADPWNVIKHGIN